LYLVYKEAGSNALRTASFDGQTWYGGTRIADQPPPAISPESNYNPATVVFNERLYLVYKGAHSNTLYTAWFDGSRWYGNTKISDQPGQPDKISPESQQSPGAAVFGDRVVIVYRGADFNDLYTSSFDGVSWSGNTKINKQPGDIDPKTILTPSVAFLPIPAGHLVSWLRDVDASTSIVDINLPGTHDSAAIAKTETLWACHNTTITEQLQGGIRLLDVRIKVVESGGTYVFYTCHGEWLQNQYQSLPSLLNECVDFLKAFPTEFIAMSLKIDNLNGLNRDLAISRLKDLLDPLPVMRSSTAPTLGEVKGKIFLLNRITADLTFGMPVCWTENTPGEWFPACPSRDVRLYVQDRYEKLPFHAALEKLRLFVNTQQVASATTGQLFLNFASATSGIFGVYINTSVVGYTGRFSAAQRFRRFGWALFDYEFDALQTDRYGFVNAVQLVIASNFEYRGYEQPFRPVGDGKDTEAAFVSAEAFAEA
jgi:hypothetical protein